MRAISSPNTGITDYRLVAESLAAEIARLGGEVLCGHEVRRVSTREDGLVLSTPAGEVEAASASTDVETERPLDSGRRINEKAQAANEGRPGSRVLAPCFTWRQ